MPNDVCHPVPLAAAYVADDAAHQALLLSAALEAPGRRLIPDKYNVFTLREVQVAAASAVTSEQQRVALEMATRFQLFAEEAQSSDFKAIALIIERLKIHLLPKEPE